VLGAERVGWDWVALQLDDGRELMFYRLRRKDGSADRFSAGALVDATGSARALGLDDVTLEPVDAWTSPRSGARYPARWRLRMAGLGLDLEIAPMLADQELDVGSRVMNHHYKGCGRCKHCRVGWSQLCRAGITVYGMTGHGGHAPFMKVPAFTLVPLADELSFEEGAAISCGTGTAYGALKRIDVSGRDTLVVFGQGPVGLSATVLGRAMGARVIAVAVSPERLSLARELGADETINARDTDAVKAIHDLTQG